MEINKQNIIIYVAAQLEWPYANEGPFKNPENSHNNPENWPKILKNR